MLTIRQLNSRVIVVLAVLCLIAMFPIGFRLVSYRNQDDNQQIVGPARSLDGQVIYLRPEDERTLLMERMNHRLFMPSGNKHVVAEAEDDEHIKAIVDDNDTGRPRRTAYPPRVNMGSCPKLFGRVMVFVAVVESSYKTYALSFLL